MKCKYCGEEMTRQIRPQTLYQSKHEGTKHFHRQIKYPQDCWSCSLKEDSCDIVYMGVDGSTEARKLLETMEWIEDEKIF
jgi:hypothetical protein